MGNFAAKIAAPLNEMTLSALPDQKPAAIHLKHEKVEKPFASHLEEANKAGSINEKIVQNEDSGMTAARQARETATERIRTAMMNGDSEGLKQAQLDYDSAGKQIRMAAEKQFYVAINSHGSSNDDIPAAVLQALSTHSEEKSPTSLTKPEVSLKDSASSSLKPKAPGSVVITSTQFQGSPAHITAIKNDCNNGFEGVSAIGCPSTESVLNSGILAKQSEAALHPTAPTSTPINPSTVVVFPGSSLNGALVNTTVPQAAPAPLTNNTGSANFHPSNPPLNMPPMIVQAPSGPSNLVPQAQNNPKPIQPTSQLNFVFPLQSPSDFGPNNVGLSGGGPTKVDSGAVAPKTIIAPGSNSIIPQVHISSYAPAGGNSGQSSSFNGVTFPGYVDLTGSMNNNTSNLGTSNPIMTGGSTTQVSNGMNRVHPATTAPATTAPAVVAPPSPAATLSPLITPALAAYFANPANVANAQAFYRANGISPSQQVPVNHQ